MENLQAEKEALKPLLETELSVLKIRLVVSSRMTTTFELFL